MLALLSLLSSTAVHAQERVGFDGQFVRPSVDSVTTLWTDDAAIRDGLIGRVGLGYVRDPVLVLSRSGGDGGALLADVGSLDVIAGWGVGAFRAALTVPVVAATSDLLEDDVGLGDLALDVKGQVFDPDTAAMGVALAARVAAPTSTVNLPLGNSGVGWQVRLILDKPVGDFRLLGNIGFDGRPVAELGDIQSGSAVLGRTGLAYAPDEAGVAFEVGASPMVGIEQVGATVPGEALLTGWTRVSDALVLRGGAGTGITRGIGAARARALVALEYKPRVDVDLDKDGILGSLDACPTAAEDFDGYKDDDGCPDDEALLNLLVKEPYGGAIVGAVVTLSGPDTTQQVASTAQVPLQSGTWRLTAEADGYARLDDMFTIEPDEPLQLVKVMEPEVKPQGRVIVRADRIEIREKVYFETLSADLRMESFDLLQEVARTLREHDDITMVRVDGHTDSRGEESFNLELSRARAESVRRFLVEHGVAPERLSAEGFGETRPVDERDVEAAWDRNRRVEFVIVERRGADKP